MRHVATEEVKSFFQDSVKKSFEQKFPQYMELYTLILKYDMGIIMEEQLKKANNIISIGKKHCETFELKDMLLPYLIEKKV